MHVNSSVNDFDYEIMMYLIILAAVILFRIVFASYIIQRGEMILAVKGVRAEQYHLKRFARFMTAVFGIVVGYIFMFWFCGTIPPGRDD